MDRRSPGELSESMITRRIRAYTSQFAETFDPSVGITPRAAAVLVPLLKKDQEWCLLFTRRAETLNRHKGQVAFPGGVAEEQDGAPETTALREAYEEIGLRPGDVNLLGRLALRLTVTDFLITPVVGLIPWPYAFTLSPQEVSRVFTIPIRWLADPANHEEQSRILPGGALEKVVYFQTYDGENLWGATARMVVELMQVLQLN
jgi:8-oxo-dGTP pyrophosphatase MutT (NUDIX family)